MAGFPSTRAGTYLLEWVQYFETWCKKGFNYFPGGITSGRFTARPYATARFMGHESARGRPSQGQGRAVAARAYSLTLRVLRNVTVPCDVCICVVFIQLPSLSNTNTLLITVHRTYVEGNTLLIHTHTLMTRLLSLYEKGEVCVNISRSNPIDKDFPKCNLILFGNLENVGTGILVNYCRFLNSEAWLLGTKAATAWSVQYKQYSSTWTASTQRRVHAVISMWQNGECTILSHSNIYKHNHILYYVGAPRYTYRI